MPPLVQALIRRQNACNEMSPRARGQVRQPLVVHLFKHRYCAAQLWVAAQEAVATTGEKVRRLRRGSAMTQEQLAKASGVSPSTIVAIERGDRPNPHPGTLGKLAKALGVSPADLLED